MSIGLATTATAATRHNVLFIISDDLTAEALGCYGNRQCRTPHIDRLAQRGVRFTRAYCQYPVCGPSRAALMSGMYPQAIGVTSNGQARRFTQQLGNRPSLAEWFKRHDYYTARVSKIYHMRVPGDITAGVDGPDHRASWTERFNCQAPEWKTPGVHRHLTNQTLRHDPSKHYNLGFGTAFYVVESRGRGTEQADVQAVDKAIQLLGCARFGTVLPGGGASPSARASGCPRVVLPPVPAGRDEARCADRRRLVRYPGRRKITQRAAHWVGGQAGGATSRAVGLLRGGGVHGCPKVGRLLGALERGGLHQNTTVVFTSDHGYHLGEHDFWQKLSLHEESARIPLVIAGPTIESAVTDSLAQQIDLFPTLAELAELPVPAHCQGKSLLEVLRDPRHRVHRQIYCMKRGGHLLRSDRWAFLSYRDGSAELYDMRADRRPVHQPRRSAGSGGSGKSRCELS